MTDVRFDSALYGITGALKNTLYALPFEIKAKTEEIRLRAGLPVTLNVRGETVFLNNNGQTAFNITDNLLITDSCALSDCYRLLCGNSVYAHTEELKNGFIMMKNGCRAGVCGRMGENGVLSEVTSINIRIAREILGCADSIVNRYSGGGLLIAGKPSSGKTTVLRDFVRQMSGRFKRVCVIDSRGEISSGLNLGPATDVIKICDKASGIEFALRTMNPDIIAFDEIGSMAELVKVQESFYSGVDIVTTAHVGSIDELYKRPVTRELIKSGAINEVAVLPNVKGGRIEFKELGTNVAV